jgi:hypothetical protein
MKAQYRSQPVRLGLVVALLLGLAGCAGDLAPARPSLLHKERAAVANLDWLSSSHTAAMFDPAPDQLELSNVRVAACQKPDASRVRPRLVIREPACADFVLGHEWSRRID